ncbi:hypothetical protein JTB14_030464 [Gonioctena quinquepunctata]|nr:hypothetical protein JTB14_030464 [Gonioctena quinquepunctata]
MDNIITNVDGDEIVNIQNDFYGLADHNDQIISLKNNALSIVQEASIHKRIFNPTNENKFRELLNASDWEILFDLTETNTVSNNCMKLSSVASNQLSPAENTGVDPNRRFAGGQLRESEHLEKISVASFT